jgi:phage terminase large subunit
MLPQMEIPKAFNNLFEPHRLHVFYGGRGGSKSESVARYLLWAGMKEPMTILCAREFQSSMRESVHQLLSSLIEKYTLQEFYRVKETEIVGENGTKFIFMGLRKNVENIKSIPNIMRCWVEEAETVSGRSWDVLMPTIRGEGSEIILTFNPDIEDSPTYQRFVVDPPSYAVVRKVNYDENPFFPEVLKTEMEEMKAKDEPSYRHIWLGEPRATVEGAIYQHELQKAKDEGRIADFPYDARYPVSCFWDIGWADHTSIWFLQIVNHQFRVIDFYQGQFQKTSHYVEVLNERKYAYDRIVLPHDAENEHANADRTWIQIVRQAFPNANVYTGKRQAIELRLEATKNMFALLHIDKERCADGLSDLARYHFAIDPDTGKSSREPFHGPESDCADAFGYMCLEMKEAKKPLNIPKRKPLPEWAKRTGVR